MQQLKAPVISNIEILPSGPSRAGRALSSHLIRLRCPEIASEARPGQFVMVRCGEDAFLPRPISIHRIDGGRIALLFKAVGKGTAWLSQRKKGELLDIFGPLGNGFTVYPGSRNLLLVGGGMGIAPLAFLADYAFGEGKKVTLIQGAKTGKYLLPVSSSQKIFDSGALPASFHVLNCTEDGSEGFKGLATGLLPHYVNNADQVFACGPAAMYQTMAKMPELKGKPVQLSLEIMMGCGTGVCYGCTIKTKKGLKQVCKDGPVFEMRDLIF